MGSTFLQTFEALIERCEVEDIEWVVMAARKIWFRRIEVVHGEASFILTNFSSRLAILSMNLEG